MTDLIDRLKLGAVNVGLHDDNSTELFDIEGANDTMAEAEAEISHLQSALEARTEGRDKLLRVAEDNDGNNDDDEAYEMGKRVGYKQAIQDTESAEQIITDDMINAAFAALPPDAQGTMGVGEMERVLLAAFPSRAAAIRKLQEQS